MQIEHLEKALGHLKQAGFIESSATSFGDTEIGFDREAFQTKAIKQLRITYKRIRQIRDAYAAQELQLRQR